MEKERKRGKFGWGDKSGKRHHERRERDKKNRIPCQYLFEKDSKLSARVVSLSVQIGNKIHPNRKSEETERQNSIFCL